PLDGSPAQKAGLKPGDVIIKVDGQDVSNLPLDKIVLRILGPAGTRVRITVLNPSTSETREMTITREKITIRNVTWTMIPGTRVAHLRIASFSRGVADEVKTALRAAHRENASGIVLDLRNNPGGLLGEAVRTTSEFLKGGDVALVKDAAGKIKHLSVRSGGVAPSIPLVALINEGTASAPEIMAGALQDAARAKLIGVKTFGTGTVLEKFSLSDGSALLLAVEEWLTPGGRVIWHQGIAPDVVVSLPEGVNPLFPQAEKNLTVEEFRSRGDAQLYRALGLLNAEKTIQAQG
ncbi:MAG TPA: S41 family peptidase, partial [Thermodesulfobacteriota bacterium]|nr:S41 family peptidase [Thermodesulfobacteriota bacterium]